MTGSGSGSAPGPGGGRTTDSHGVPWADRELSPAAYATDDGSADPAVLAALAQVVRTPSSDTETELLQLVARSRWLVPIVAVAVDTELRGGLRVEGRAEMATPTLTAPDGRRALPVFSGVSTLMAWQSDARPQPITAAAAAQAAIQDECDTMIIDLGADHAVVLRPSMVWALAMVREWLPAHQDPVVAAGIAAAVADEPQVLGHALGDGAPPASGVLRVTLTLAPGLAPADVELLATRVGERIARDGELRARIDGLAFTIR